MRPCIVDSIFPIGEIHIIAGASGVGKTTLGFQMLQDWSEGRTVFGYRSNPCPFVYVSCDRSKGSVQETLGRLDIDPATIKMIDARGISKHGTDGFKHILDAARLLVPDVRVLFIEAFSLLIPVGKHIELYRTTADYLSAISRQLEKEKLTILGTSHSPKQRKDDEIIDPRQLVLGTVAWGGFVETIVAMQRVAPMNALDQRRRIYVLPRNAREEMFEYDVDKHGRFVEVGYESVTAVFDSYLTRLATGLLIPYERFTAAAEKSGISRSSLDKWLSDKVSDGILKRVTKGQYQVAPKQ